MAKVEEVKIRGLTKMEKDQLKELAGQASLNDFLLEKIRSLLVSEFSQNQLAAYQHFLKQLKETQDQQLNQLDLLLSQRRDDLASQKRYAEL